MKALPDRTGQQFQSTEKYARPDSPVEVVGRAREGGPECPICADYGEAECAKTDEPAFEGDTSGRLCGGTGRDPSGWDGFDALHVLRGTNVLGEPYEATITEPGLRKRFKRVRP